MLPPIPNLSDYGISSDYGFLPSELPIERLPDPYYHKWEAIVANLQSLIFTKRLRGVVDRLPILSTAGLEHDAEWRRAYSLLCFMAHAYIWGADIPSERLPASIAVPFTHIAKHLEVPPVATYAGVVLWNFKPLFQDEHVDNLENVATLTTFTGSIDESWFYLVSVAIEARAAPVLPLVTTAMAAARRDDVVTVAACLRVFAERLDELGALLRRMHESCDPHVFYHRIRPFLAGSKNMGDAGLPNGVFYEDGMDGGDWRTYAGGSNAQSSILQFFDIALGVVHRPTGEKKDTASDRGLPGSAPPPKHNFLLEMRKYMPGAHRRFLEDVTRVANIREFVETHRNDSDLSLAYDACLAMLQEFRNTHINIVSRYIIVKSREANAPPKSRTTEPEHDAAVAVAKVNLATASRKLSDESKRKNLKGTGGTALIPFLKQARDETGEQAVANWARRILQKNTLRPAATRDTGAVNVPGKPVVQTVSLDVHGLSGNWTVDEEFGGICHY